MGETYTILVLTIWAYLIICSYSKVFKYRTEYRQNLSGIKKTELSVFPTLSPADLLWVKNDTSLSYQKSPQFGLYLINLN